jgi:predicted nucleotidyltransferase component of viral defense system
VPELSPLRLVGGTALALQLGHRQSVDLDFFGNFDAKRQNVIDAITRDGFVVQENNKGETIILCKIDTVKVDIVRYQYEWLEAAIEEDGVRMAGLKDIAAMKLAAVAGRGSKKDFVDVYFLLQHFSLQQMLDFFAKRYEQGSLFHVIRSLTYFEDAEPIPMPDMFVDTSWDTVKSTLRGEVRKLR